jgi:hypothetical protein
MSAFEGKADMTQSGHGLATQLPASELTLGPLQCASLRRYIRPEPWGKAMRRCNFIPEISASAAPRAARVLEGVT